MMVANVTIACLHLHTQSCRGCACVCCRHYANIGLFPLHTFKCCPLHLVHPPSFSSSCLCNRISSSSKCAVLFFWCHWYLRCVCLLNIHSLTPLPFSCSWRGPTVCVIAQKKATQRRHERFSKLLTQDHEVGQQRWHLCFVSLDYGVYYLRIENAEGDVLIAVYLFIYIFVCVLLA